MVEGSVDVRLGGEPVGGVGVKALIAEMEILPGDQICMNT